MITIYTDGSCTPNPGTGVCAFIATRDGQELFRHVDKYEDSTNNRMELMAVINAITWYGSTKHVEPLKIVTDSQYVKNGITEWILNWQKNGWKGSGGKNVLNKQYWVELDELNRNYQIVWEWTKGHADNKWNNEVDKLCTEGYSKESTSGKQVLPLIQQTDNMANKQKYYLVPAEYLESNEPDLFENGAQAACDALGAVGIETNIPLADMVITNEFTNLADAIRYYYSNGPNPENFTIGMSSDGEFAAYGNNHSDNWITIGNLKTLYDQIISKFGK